ncbi:hypothetical protein LUZ60_008266 [Juncus effusus]|nr:hypothetical protein LUZ60_008266 [Juncus effusus]
MDLYLTSGPLSPFLILIITSPYPKPVFPSVSFVALFSLLNKLVAMEVAEKWKEILKIQKFRRIVSYTGFYCFATLVTYAYTSNTTRAGISRADQYYAAYPAGTELLTDTSKLYKAALGNCFEIEEWGPIEFSVMAKHFDRQGKPPYAYHAQYMAHLLSHGQFDGSG